MYKRILLAITLVAGSLHGDWRMMNLNRRGTRSPEETILNPGNVGNLTPIWSTVGQPNTAAVQGAPVVVDNIVIYGDTAGILHGKSVVDGTDVPNTPINLGSTIAGAVTVTNNALYVATNDMKLHAFNRDFTVKTEFNGGFVIVDPAGIGFGEILAAPVVVKNIVIVPITNNLANVTTNINTTLRGSINAFNATTGEFLWRLLPNEAPLGFGAGSWSTAAVDKKRGLIFIGTANATTPPGGPNSAALLAINFRTGKIKWVQQYTKDAVWSALYPCGKDYDVGASPNLFSIRKNGEKIQVVGDGSKRGKYRIFRRSDGKEIDVLPMIPHDATPSINGNPSAAYSKRTIFTTANFDTSGLPVNVISILAQNSNIPALLSLINIIQNLDQTTIRAFDVKTGELKWTNIKSGASFPSTTHANGVIYTANGNGIFRALSAENGAELFSTGLGNALGAPITVDGGRIFVGVGIGGVPGGLTVFGLP
jgi:polyvinyl alcohol dehydrogenase (cytochrome)